MVCKRICIIARIMVLISIASLAISQMKNDHAVSNAYLSPDVDMPAAPDTKVNALPL